MTGGNESDNDQSQLKRNKNVMNKSKRCCLGFGFGPTENKTLQRELNLTRWQYCELFFASSAKARSEFKKSQACGAKEEAEGKRRGTKEVEK
jgi:hypothetical protein